MASLLHTKKHIPGKWKTRQEIIFEEKFEQHKLGAHPKLSWKCRTCWIFNIPVHYSTFKADQVYIPSLAVSVNICLYQSEYIMRKAVPKFPWTLWSKFCLHTLVMIFNSFGSIWKSVTITLQDISRKSSNLRQRPQENWKGNQVMKGKLQFGYIFL